MSKYRDLRFDAVESAQHLRQLADFLRAHPGSYAGERHEQWIDEVCIPGIESGERTALAWFQDGEIVGDTVLKVDDITSNTVEIKNFRVLNVDKLNGRKINHIGDFMITQAISEAVDLLVDTNQLTSDADAITINLDTTEGNPVISFFERYGFEEIGRAELYLPGQTEILMAARVPVA